MADDDDDEWEVPEAFQPDPSEFSFDLEERLASVVAIKSIVPPDATSAPSLGMEREGSGVWIDAAGLVLTVGYLITEAETVWITANDGRVVEATPLGMDFETGFGLVQTLGRLPGQKVAPLGDSASMGHGTSGVLAAAGGISHALACTVAARQPFAGYWEYLLEDAIFTAPAHPHWGGAGLFGADGKLVGIGSLILQQGQQGGKRLDLNMVVPIGELLPILETLRRTGHSGRPARPWLGLYATEDDEAVGVGSLAKGGPAEKAGVKPRDRIVAVDGQKVNDLASLWTAVRAAGPAGAEVRLTLARGSRQLDLAIVSSDRTRFLKAPRLH
ncbi:S1C family serine protease [Roseococcus sp.]|uniref:S1C family serine protease n=1 Tax=Roseococcus sp. TaxID=2109646 RepID=UPI003BA89A6A